MRRTRPRARCGVGSVLALIATALALTSCPRPTEPRPAVSGEVFPAAALPNSGAGPFHVRLDHLRRLGLDATVGGVHVRVVALYARAPDYHPVASPPRDGNEGVACVDDAARAAVVYLRDHEATGDPRSLADARALLAFVIAMEQGDGELVNFIDAAGSPNLVAATSKKSFSYWAARALWALGEAVRVVQPRSPAIAATYRTVLDRVVARFGRDVAANKLPGGTTVAAAEGLLGLLAYEQVAPSPDKASLAEHAALLLACLRDGELPCTSVDELTSRIRQADLARAPWGARSDGPVWHAWGARATEALARAGKVLGRPAFIAAARQEADALWTRMLVAGLFPAEIAKDGSVRLYPQIAYGLSPIVGGFLALADATADARYAVLGGLTAAWFLGANPAAVPMYDEATGRTFDGIDGSGINHDAGAESTVEALLALGAVSRNPSAARYVRYRFVGPARALTQPGLRRELTFGDRRVVLVAEGEHALRDTVRIDWGGISPAP